MASDNQIIVVDIDGTLYDCSHREHLAVARQWDEFNAGIPDDTINDDVKEFIVKMSESFDIYLLTGRMEKYRSETQYKLRTDGIADYITEIIMRPDDDFSSDAVTKPRMLELLCGGHQEGILRVLCILEDRDKMVEAWRNIGYNCWQVRTGAF